MEKDFAPGESQSIQPETPGVSVLVELQPFQPASGTDTDSESIQPEMPRMSAFVRLQPFQSASGMDTDTETDLGQDEVKRLQPERPGMSTLVQLHDIFTS